MSALIACSAFWANDQPYGFGSSIFRDGCADSFFDTFHHQAEQLGINLHVRPFYVPVCADG